MSDIKKNIENIIQEITTSANNSGKDASSIKLLAVSKKKPISAIEEAIEAGQQDFGENYIQEGIDKIHFFSNSPNKLNWHLIGPIQSNKTKLVAEHFDWVHTIDRAKIAQRLNEQRPANMKPLDVLIQVNTSDEASKSGLSITSKTDILDLANTINQLPNLRLRGLMCIPAPQNTYQAQLNEFAAITALFNEMTLMNDHFDTLSMGMSDDMAAAIASGSTMVRIGTAIFGSRTE